jgi:hypothetical protein
MIAPDFTVDQEHGARWSVFSHPNSDEGFTILTSAGAELLQSPEDGSIRSLIHRYRAAEVGSIALLGEDQGIRQELGQGKQATVYSMGGVRSTGSKWYTKFLHCAR